MRAFSSSRAILFSIDLATLRQHAIRDLGEDLRPGSNLGPGIRFSLSPDGRSMTYSTYRFGSVLWMLQGYRLPGKFGEL